MGVGASAGVSTGAGAGVGAGVGVPVEAIRRRQIEAAVLNLVLTAPRRALCSPIN